MIPPDVLATTLKHLNVKRHNYFRSIEEHPEDPQMEFWNTEIDAINVAIRFYEGVREEQRITP